MNCELSRAFLKLEGQMITLERREYTFVPVNRILGILALMLGDGEGDTVLGFSFSKTQKRYKPPERCWEDIQTDSELNLPVGNLGKFCRRRRSIAR